MIHADFRFESLSRAPRCVGDFDSPITSPIQTRLPIARIIDLTTVPSIKVYPEKEKKRLKNPEREVLNANEIGSINVIPGIYLRRSARAIFTTAFRGLNFNRLNGGRQRSYSRTTDRSPFKRITRKHSSLIK